METEPTTKHQSFKSGSLMYRNLKHEVDLTTECFHLGIILNGKELD
jgi:hypothetical protein